MFCVLASNSSFADDESADAFFDALIRRQVQIYSASWHGRYRIDHDAGRRVPIQRALSITAVH